MKVVKNIVLWVLSVFLLGMALVLFIDRFLSGFLMLLAALFCNPLALSLVAKSGKKVKKRVSIPCVIILFLAAFMTMPDSNGIDNGTASPGIEAAQNEGFTEQTPTAAEQEFQSDKDTLDSELTVHFLDIGQGDAALIACDGEYMLIDAGDNDKGTAVQNYLTKQGVTKLKYL